MAAIGRMRLVALAIIVAGAAAIASARADAATPIPPAPTEFVTDRAGFLSPAVASELSQKLAAYERSSGHQLIVYIDKTTGGVPIEDWAVKAFSAWGVGRKGLDDGVALFIFSDDRKLRIEVGYGLEDKVPDARAGRIIENAMVPRIRDGNRDGAVKAGVDSLIDAIGGKGESYTVTTGSPWAALAFPGMLLFFFIVFMLRSRFPRSVFIGGGGWGGGWSSGGGGFGGGSGGFSGGGGSSGGGGASGGW